MLPDIWQAGLKVVFVGAAVDEASDILGFYHAHQRDRFWELAELGGIIPKRFITAAELKALREGHARGTLSDPIRLIFIQKKSARLLDLGIGLTTLNRRLVVASEKDKGARPVPGDVRELEERVQTMPPRILAFVMDGDLFRETFSDRAPEAAAAPGPQPFRVGGVETWLLGPPAVRLRGEALTVQEDAFFALGERISSAGG